MQACAACHGYQDGDHYVFKGEYLGKVEPNAKLGTDPARLNSYTEQLRDYQVSELFKGTPYQFSHFEKTDGYANMPLDGLWLRAPYLHDGSVPTLADLLEPPTERPVAFVRGLDTIDPEKGGFAAPACDPEGPPPESGLLLRHEPARQRRRRPPLRHRSGARRQGRPLGLSPHLLTRGTIR